MLKQIIKKPIISEKGFYNAKSGKFSFIVDKNASKLEIKKAVETLYKVNVVKLNSLNIRGKKKITKGKTGKRSDKKIVILSLKENQTIDLFEIEKNKKDDKKKKEIIKKDK